MWPSKLMITAFALVGLARARRVQIGRSVSGNHDGMREAFKGLISEAHGVSKEDAEFVVRQAELTESFVEEQTSLTQETSAGSASDALASLMLSVDAAPAFAAPRSPALNRRSSKISMEGDEGKSGTVIVFGGTGGTGSEAVYQAIQRGDRVVTLARDPLKLLIPPGSGEEGNQAGKPFEQFFSATRLTVIQGDVTNQADVDKVFAVHKDVKGVVVALGGKTKDVGPTMLQDGTKNIIAACKANDVKRIAAVTSIGVGDSMDQAPWTFRLLMMTVMKSIMEDKNAQEELIMKEGADLDYTIVRPGGLKDAPPTGIVTAGKDQEAGAITRADVAAFCLDAILEPEFQFLKQAVSISSNMGSGFQSVLADKTKSRMAMKKEE